MSGIGVGVVPSVGANSASVTACSAGVPASPLCGSATTAPSASEPAARWRSSR